VTEDTDMETEEYRKGQKASVKGQSTMV